MEGSMMAQFSDPPKPQRPNSELDAWREYAAQVSRAIRERREDAYDDGARNETSGKPASPPRGTDAQP